MNRGSNKLKQSEQMFLYSNIHVDYPQSHTVRDKQKRVLKGGSLLALPVRLDCLSLVSKHSLLLIPTEYDPLTFTQTKHRHLFPMKTQAEQFKTETRTSILWF